MPRERVPRVSDIAWRLPRSQLDKLQRTVGAAGGGATVYEGVDFYV